MKWLIALMLLSGCPEEETTPDAAIGPICDCDDTTDYPTCGLCPIGKPDGGV